MPEQTSQASWLHWLLVIKLENVTMKYKASSRPALSDLDLEVGKGEFAFLIGPSG